MAKRLEIRNCTQLKVWVRKWLDGEKFDVRKGQSNPLKGRPRTVFDTVEEERDYLKTQVDYLKKQYPNLVKEASSVSKTYGIEVESSLGEGTNVIIRIPYNE